MFHCTAFQLHGYLIQTRADLTVRLEGLVLPEELDSPQADRIEHTPRERRGQVQ